jgi:2-oxoglutarate dehydrogenase complex dehydrogenase (E1) component-like enzyme
MERFLQCCADGNMVVVNCTTPANFFHAAPSAGLGFPQAAGGVHSEEPVASSALREQAWTNSPTAGFQEVIDDASSRRRRR